MKIYFLLLACVLLVLSGCFLWERTGQETSTGTDRQVSKTTEIVAGTEQGQPTHLKKTVFTETLTEREAQRDIHSSSQPSTSSSSGSGFHGMDTGTLLGIAGTLLGGGAGGSFLANRKRRKETEAKSS